MAKKPKIQTQISHLKAAVRNEAAEKVPAKTNVTLLVNASLLDKSKRKFGRRLSAIFEAALKDALILEKEELPDDEE